MRAVSREQLRGDAVNVAPWLLNKLLVVDRDGARCVGRVSEVEAYRGDDPASHSFGGITRRNATMFGPPGHLYVYLIYGLHWCANVVTGTEGEGAAVLIRGVEPVLGVEVMRRRRGRLPLADGPAKLTQAFAIDGADDGLDLCDAGPIGLFDDGQLPPISPRIGPRVGISRGVEMPWRWRTGAAGAVRHA